MSEQALFLLVEDDENDIVLIRRSFIKANVLNPLHVVRTGEEAIEYLTGEGKYARRGEFPLPGLVLLDLKLGKMDGLEVLRWIRKQKGLSSIRVVILTASDDMRDVNEAYQAGANSFLIKPLDFERFVEVSQAISGYWLWLDKSPESARPARSDQPEGSTKHREAIRRYGWS